MSEDSSQKSQQQKSWIEKLSYLLHPEPQNKQELLELLTDATDRKLIDIQALEMIEGVMEVTQMQVRDIMIPRSQMVCVDYDDTPSDFIPKIKQSGHSRFPVIGENKDQVIGILLAKDLIDIDFSQSDFKLSAYFRAANFVPESKRVDILLSDFRQNRNHMAIVIDEYGQVSGLVTIEDVLEEIVGDISDEHDKKEDKSPIKKISHSKYTIDGLTPIEDFNEYFACELSDEEFDTIGGLVTHHLGHMPTSGEQVVFEKFCFKVIHTEKRRLSLLEMTIVCE
ncbi:MAG: magnesium/cobalt efflux protein [Legionellales bacterium]|nr:magnesium/cobalt efflux protein [Legionellales bacterium]|tara:strand:- start:2228 stop:3070 length:843 start_codon:yes stop_codon:yes gene_type:complete